MRAFALYLIGLAVAIFAAPAAADPAEGLVDRIDACVELVGATGDNAVYCLGIYSEPCIDVSDNQTTQGMVDCFSVEIGAWNEILNREYAQLAAILSPSQSNALTDAQDKWAAFRDADCAFPHKIIDGPMAHPWAADCIMQHTARRAVELRGIIEFVEY